MADYDDDGGGPSDRFGLGPDSGLTPLGQMEALDASLRAEAAEATGAPAPIIVARPAPNPDGSGGTNEPGWFPRWAAALRPVRPAIIAGSSSPAEPQRALPTHGAAADPYAPFKGLPAEWSSHVYDDGGTFEGLTYAGQPHGPGVMVAGDDGGGGGMAGLEAGDRYEGEWHTGFAHGLGIALAGTTVYKGEWVLGKRHGCGSQVDLAPFYEAVADGADPDEAWEAMRAEIEGRAVAGTWVGDALLARSAPDGAGPPPRARLPGRKGRKGPAGTSKATIALCTVGEVAATVDETEDIAARAALFTYKPGGSVATMAAHDASGLPAPVMQDPLHYPHGTKFLAPGPLGQCFALPESRPLKAAMAAAAEAHAATWADYNLDYDIAPGSALDEARALARAQASRHLGNMRRSLAFMGRLVRLEASKVALEMDRERREAGDGGDARPVDAADLDAADLVAASPSPASSSPPPSGGGGGGSARPRGVVGSISLSALSGGPRAPWVRRR